MPKKKTATQKIQATLSDNHLKALKKYAKEHGLLRGGKPNINAALRMTSADGLGDPSLVDEVLPGNPDKRSKS